jgi:serine/threonine-protein kinase
VAPENIREYRDPEPNADIYSLGATLYFAAAGRSPFPTGKGPTEKLTAQVTGRAAPLREANPSVSKDLAEVIMKMLRKDPDKRYAFIDQVHTEFEDMRSLSLS